MKTFNDYLMEQHDKQYHGIADDAPDDYQDWVDCLQPYEWIDLVEEYTNDKLQQQEKEMVEKLKVINFMYEHQWVGEDDLRLCEVCGEQVKKGSPCKESKHYLCYKAIDDIIVLHSTPVEDRKREV